MFGVGSVVPDENACSKGKDYLFQASGWADKIREFTYRKHDKEDILNGVFTSRSCYA